VPSRAPGKCGGSTQGTSLWSRGGAGNSVRSHGSWAACGGGAARDWEAAGRGRGSPRGSRPQHLLPGWIAFQEFSSRTNATHACVRRRSSATVPYRRQKPQHTKSFVSSFAPVPQDVIMHRLHRFNALLYKHFLEIIYHAIPRHARCTSSFFLLRRNTESKQ
jgi:hypothetical protein